MTIDYDYWKDDEERKVIKFLDSLEDNEILSLLEDDMNIYDVKDKLNDSLDYKWKEATNDKNECLCLDYLDNFELMEYLEKRFNIRSIEITLYKIKIKK